MPVFLQLPQTRIELLSPAKTVASTGTLFWSENFESGGTSRWSGGTIESTARRFRSGQSSLKITSAAGSPFTTSVTTTEFGTTPELMNSLVGIECYIDPEICSLGAGGMAECGIRIRMDSTVRVDFGLNLVITAANTGKLQILDSTGGFVDVAGAASLPLSIGSMYRMKIIFNPSTQKYVRVEFNYHAYDVSTVVSYNTQATGDLASITLQVTGIDATTKSVWFDDIMVTYNEKP